jgi:DNA polymerase-3 subunit gamma/tau
VAVVTEEEQEERAQPEAAPALDLEAFRSLWPAVLETVRGQNAMLAALLEGANPVEVAAGELRLAFAESAAFLKRKAEGIPNRETLGQAIQAVTGSTLKLVYELRTDAETEEVAAEALSDEDLVARVMAEFDAEELPLDEPEEG